MAFGFGGIGLGPLDLGGLDWGDWIEAFGFVGIGLGPFNWIGVWDLAFAEPTAFIVIPVLQLDRRQGGGV